MSFEFFTAPKISVIRTQGSSTEDAPGLVLTKRWGTDHLKKIKNQEPISNTFGSLFQEPIAVVLEKEEVR